MHSRRPGLAPAVEYSWAPYSRNPSKMSSALPIKPLKLPKPRTSCDYNTLGLPKDSNSRLPELLFAFPSVCAIFKREGKRKLDFCWHYFIKNIRSPDPPTTIDFGIVSVRSEKFSTHRKFLLSPPKKKNQQFSSRHLLVLPCILFSRTCVSWQTYFDFA